MNKNKIYKLFLTLPLLLMLVAASGWGQTGDFLSATDRYNTIDSGEFASGKLVYIADGKDLGSETFKLIKKPSGTIVAKSEGVVTPPIPIPFIKPKIKYNQTAEVSSNLIPLSLFLQYKGLLGIGNKKINVTVEGNNVTAEIGNDVKKANVNPEKSVFSGIGGSQVLFAFILSQKVGQTSFTEIRSGASGPQGDSPAIEMDIELLDTQIVKMEINGTPTEVTEYTFREIESERVKIITVIDGTFIAYRSKDSENPFYLYREDLLGEDFSF